MTTYTFFIFLGLITSDSDADLLLLQDRVSRALAAAHANAEVELQEGSVVINMKDPDFSIRIVFVQNTDQETLDEWRDLADNFELPWDCKPVNVLRMERILHYMKQNGWDQYMKHLQFAYVILDEMEQFKGLKVYTIPSAEDC